MAMYLTIETFSHYPVYAAYTPVSSTIYISPWLTNQVKAEVKSK